jgi:hypothetical protein
LQFYPEGSLVPHQLLLHGLDSTLFLVSKQAFFGLNTALVSPQSIYAGSSLLQLVMTAVQLPDQQPVPPQHGGKLDLHCRLLCCRSDDSLLRPLQINFKSALLLSVLQNKLASDRKKNIQFVDMR